MLNLLEVYSNRKGFTLVEIVLSIAILSIILSSIFSLLFFVNTIKNRSDNIDTALFNGRYAMEYIKEEITSADKIICSTNFDNLDEDYPNNIGFVTLEEKTSYNKDGKINGINYNFRTYYLKDDKLIRLAYNTSNGSLYKSDLFSGHNQICDKVIELNRCNFDEENNLINLSITIDQGTKPLLLETAINVRCNVE